MLRSKQRKKYTHILFDFDGTLADTLPQSLEVMNRILKRKDNPLTSSDVSRILGYDNLQDIFDELNINRLLLPYYTYQFRKQVKSTVAQAKLHTGMEETLSYQFDRATISILSSNSTENIELFLKKHAIFEYFEHIEGGVSPFGKTRALKKFVKKNSIKKSDILYVGDEVRDIIACRRARIDVASASWGSTPVKRLKVERPTYLLNQPKQLKKFVK